MSDLMEHWDQRYRENQIPWNSEKPSTELVHLLESGRVAPGRAFEPGCGYGTNALYLARQGFDVTAVDLSPTAIEEAKRRASDAGLEVDFRAANLLAGDDFGGPYDFLFDRGVYHVVRSVDLDAYLRLLERISRSGTRYLCLCGNANETWEGVGPPRVTEEQIRGELGPLFDILDLHEFRFDLSPSIPARPLAWSAFMVRKG